MGSKIYIIFEYLYIAMAVFSIYIVISVWSEDRNRAYLFMFFAVVAVFMFFFKRNFRKKITDRNKQE